MNSSEDTQVAVTKLKHGAIESRFRPILGSAAERVRVDPHGVRLHGVPIEHRSHSGGVEWMLIGCDIGSVRRGMSRSLDGISQVLEEHDPTRAVAHCRASVIFSTLAKSGPDLR